MFQLLHAHEERDPKAVLKTQSKRAQKRLIRAELRKEERDTHHGASGRGELEDFNPGRGVDRGHGLQRRQAETELETAAARMYQDLLGEGDVDPTLLDDIAAQVERMRVGCQSGSGGRCASENGHASERQGSLFTDYPPGPGPGLSNSSRAHHRDGQAPPSAGSWSQPLSPAALHCVPWGGYDSSSGSSRPSTSSSVGAAAHRPSQRASPSQPKEEFPSLPAPTHSSRPTAAGGGGLARKGTRASGHSRNGFPVARHGHTSGVKVLHAARPVHNPPHSGCGLQPSGSGELERQGSGEGQLNLSLLWDLLEGGMSLLPDALADAKHSGDLEGIGPDAQAAVRRLVAAQCAQGDGSKPARCVSQEDMIAMMARAHNRQFHGSSSAAAAGGSSDSDDDEAHYYGREAGERGTRDWRHMIDYMERTDWVRVKNTDGKHYKYRRLLPNGRIQTQTVCCSPSDALRGIRNFIADLAKKDAEANAVIREWRALQRQRKAGAPSSPKE